MKLAVGSIASKARLVIVACASIVSFSVNAFSISTIAGTVYDKQRNPLRDIEVELLDEYYRIFQNGGRTRTDGSGRYQFSGLPDGRYTVRVYAFRHDLEDQEFPVEVRTQNIRGGEGSGYFTQDFVLIPRKGGLKDAELSVVFVQEIPKDAETAFKRSAQHLSNKRDAEGFAELKKAIDIFPDYYAALYRYGQELFIRKRFADAVHVFIKTSEINPKSAASLYYLGSSLHNLGSEYNKSSLTALQQALILAPASVQVLWQIGKVERGIGKFSDAEKHLLLAKKLSTSRVPEIHKELAQLYANDLKKFAEAAAELEQYLKASKMTGEDEKKTRKLIEDLRKKAGGRS